MKMWKNYITILLALLSIAEALIISFLWLKTNELNAIIAMSSIEGSDASKNTKELEHKVKVAQSRIRELQATIDRVTADNDLSPATNGLSTPRHEGAAEKAHLLQLSRRDPAAIEARQRDQIVKRYSSLYDHLQLADDKRNQLTELLLSKKKVALDVAESALDQGKDILENPAVLPKLIDSAKNEIDTKIKDLLGDSGYENYQAYDLVTGQSNLMAKVQNVLMSNGTPLNETQLTHVQQIVSDNHVAHLNDKILASAASVVSEQQLNTLKTLYRQQQSISVKTKTGQ
jgi:hypothetical protein